MFVRKKPNRSGSVSVQIVDKSGGKYRVVKSLGSALDEETIRRLVHEARRQIDRLQRQATFSFATEEEEAMLRFAHSLSNSDIVPVGAKLVFGRLYDRIGFDVIKEPLLKELVISRIVYPGSKLKLTEYLQRYEKRQISVQRIYRFLDTFHCRYKERIEAIAFRHTQKVLGAIHVVFYDMTTLYFEAEEEDDFRKIGFSKDGKFQHPQIMLGLLVGEKGYPLGYELFEGNTYEGHTLVPVLERFQQRFDLDKPIVIADSGLLSQANIDTLTQKGYGYILGARIKKLDARLSRAIHDLQLQTDGAVGELRLEDGTRLIVSYSEQRAKKDRYNRQRGLQRLQKRIKSGKLTKEQINNRGYNKYLKLKGSVEVAIDYERYEADSVWNGLKGYRTNTTLSAQSVLENYAHLWQIEKAFRMSKSDLRIRPIYHFVRRRIEAHISICFIAYTVYKELERLLQKHHAPFSVQQAKEFVHHIYQLEFTLPESQRHYQVLLKMDETQQQLLDIIEAG